MQDELQHGIDFGGAEWVSPPEEGTEAHSLLVKWTKRDDNLIEDFRGKVFPVRLGEDQDLVGIVHPKKGTVAVVWREKGDLIDLPDGKTWRQFTILGLRPFVDQDSAAQFLRAIQASRELVVARDIDGFGDTPVVRVEDVDIDGFGPEAPEGEDDEELVVVE